ncbi:MAG TPA: 16S rRNA (adenine(1518)-N(6)/adenine(1519)-N(6))-dimethyltransferase RsmA [Candidatus Acidoferrales bacterium]
MTGGSRRPLGQHFLVDASVSKRVLTELCPQPGQAWLEIGPGHGGLTREIAQAGADVLAVELDSALAAQLQQRTTNLANLRVLTGDILAIDLEKELAVYAKPVHIYGSLPYYITSPILSRLFHLMDKVADATIVVQHEVAQRLVARPGSRAYGFLSVEAQWFATCRILFRIAPHAFRPKPKVWSALVRLAPPGRKQDLKVVNAEQFLEFVGLCFRQKRKTLLNNLRGRYGGEKVLTALMLNHLKNKTRAEELSVEELAHLFQLLHV